MSWPFIDADDELVADLLAGTVDVVLENGGWLNPEARLVARDGDLRIESAADDGAPLVTVPREAFLRVDRVSWLPGAERLEFADVPDDLSGTERELLILLTALFNACDKVLSLVRSHPRLDPTLPDFVIDAVRPFVPTFRVSPATPAQVLWGTRAFRLPVGPDGEAEPVAVPIVDLLNHAPRADMGTWTGAAFSVTTHHVDGGRESVIAYRDDRGPLPMAVVYGFADALSTLAESARLEVPAPDAEPIVVGDGRHGEVRLVFRADDLPGVVEELSLATRLPVRRSRDVLRAAAQQNLDLLDHLIDAADAASGSVAAGILAAAARRQRQVVEPFAS